MKDYTLIVKVNGYKMEIAASASGFRTAKDAIRQAQAHFDENDIPLTVKSARVLTEKDKEMFKQFPGNEFNNKKFFKEEKDD